MMTHVRFNHRNCMPERSEYPISHDLMNWFWNDFDNGFKERSVPLANIVETKQDFRIELFVPGFSKTDFKIKLEGQILSITGEMVSPVDNQDESFVRHEFSRSAFSRSFRLSNWIDSTNIVARCENGILLVTVPKTEEAKLKPSKEIVVD
jgi:HSP20 family protein